MRACQKEKEGKKRRENYDLQFILKQIVKSGRAGEDTNEIRLLMSCLVADKGSPCKQLAGFVVAGAVVIVAVRRRP